MDVFDVLVDLIDFNESVNFRLIIGIILGYFFTLWLVIVLWVYFDAKRRYKSDIHPPAMALGTLILSFPFLIFYLLIRPDSEHDEYDWHEDERPGVNIPMINFQGKDGIEMSLNLTVHPKLKSSKESDIKVGVSIEPDDDKFEIKEVEELIEDADKIEEEYGDSKMLDGLQRGLQRIKNLTRRRMGFVIKEKGRAKKSKSKSRKTESEKKKTKSRKRRKRKEP